MSRIENYLRIAAERERVYQNIRKYGWVIIGLIIFITVGGLLMSASLNISRETDSTNTSSQGLTIITHISTKANVVKDESIPLEISVKNEGRKPISFAVYPTIIFSENRIYNGTTDMGNILPNQTIKYHHSMPFREVGENSMSLVIHSNVTGDIVMPVDFTNFNVVTQERYYQIQDQQFYYSILGIIAIPVVISTIKNLKDIFQGQ